MNSVSPNDRDVVIVAAKRTPMLRATKDPSQRPPPMLFLQTVLSAVLEQAQVNGSDIQDISVGNVLMGPNGFVTCRMGHVMAGIPAETCSLQLVNRQCASGLQAVADIAHRIALGEIDVGIGAGIECMSHNSMHSIKPPTIGKQSGINKEALDCLLPMGLTSESVVKKYGLKRHTLDQCAVESHKRANKAQTTGKFDNEIASLNWKTSDGSTVTFDKDTGIRPDTSLQTLTKLKPAFVPVTGVTTAGNSSQMTDGAAAVLLMTRAEARKRQLPILGVWRTMVTVGVPPHIMGIGPAVAIPKLLDHMHMAKEDIDVYEINEAFASQYYYTVDSLNLDTNLVNPNGGAMALGHPLGCTGARLMVSILYELERRQGKKGVVSMCIGTGMGAAALIEREGDSVNSRLSSKL